MASFVIKELSASEITESALIELNARGCEVWRQNNLSVRGRAFTGKKGLPDIMGYVRATGIAVYCETKKIGDTIKVEQAEFLSKAHTAGCISLIATQVNHEVKILSLHDLFNNIYQEVDQIQKILRAMENIRVDLSSEIK